jgi:glucokinase
MSSPVVVGLDFGGTKIAAAVCDLAGRRLGTTTVPTMPEGGARAALERAIDAARRLVYDTASDDELLAVGASTFGIPGEHGVALAPAVPGWDSIALGNELGEAFIGADITVATDVKAGAFVEVEYGALAGCDPGVYLNLGTGLAAALVIGGRVVGGQHGASGEIGYHLRSVDDLGVLAADRRMLEDVVSGSALRRAAMALSPDGVDAADVFARAPHSPALAELVRAFVRELSFHVVNLAITVDPARIAVGGGLVRSWGQIEGPLRLALKAAVPYPPELVVARFPYDAPLLGALALATSAARDRLTKRIPAWADQ